MSSRHCIDCQMATSVNGCWRHSRVAVGAPVDVSASNVLASWAFQFDFTDEPGRLGRLQGRLQDGRLWWLGNRLSDLRWLIWKAIR